MKPKSWVVVFIALALICGAMAWVGLPRPHDPINWGMVNQRQQDVRDFASLKHVTSEGAGVLAERLLELNRARPASLGYSNGHAYLQIPHEKDLWETILSPRSIRTRIFDLPDRHGSFEKRWNASLKAVFYGPWRPRFGRVTLTKRTSSSTNPLEHLDFKFAP